MKRIACMLLALLALCIPASAETLPGASPVNEATPGASPTLETTPGASPTIEATPTPQPDGVRYDDSDFSLYLPERLIIQAADALEAYAFAVRADYPDAPEARLVALDAQGGAALCVYVGDSELDGPTAAREAAQALLGSDDGALTLEKGGRSFGGFACAMDETTFRLYYVSNGARLICLACSGLDDGEIDALLTSLNF